MKDTRYLTTSVCPGSQELSDLLERSSEGLRRYHLIMTAWDLGLFDRTAVPVGHEDLALQLGLHPQMTKLFCEALAEVGLLEKAGPEYVSSPLARDYLGRASPHYMMSTMRNLKLNNDRWARLADVLRDGPVVQERKDRFNDDWLISIAEWAGTGSVREAIEVVATHANMKRWRRLLDLGGGHGLYSIAFTAIVPDLEAVVFDLPSVIPLTQRYIEQFEAERVRTMPGDFYKDDIGDGYDVIFTSFNQSANDPALIPKIYNALRPGGDLVIRRFEDDGRNDAMNTLDWNLITFEGKKIGSKRHTSDTVPGKEEYLRRLEDNGFAVRSVVPADAMSVMIFARRPMTGGAESDG